jgi:catechol 2,3-dioxygenase-like lactoylglutathione lyase family enzyme
MQIDKIDHVNIRTSDVLATSGFFASVLGMNIIPTPGQPDLTKSAWICDMDGRAAVHVTGPGTLYPWEDKANPPSPSAPGSGRIHHVAFACTGYEEMLRRLAETGMDYTPNEVAQAGLRQVFITDPNGIILELNFFGD